MEYIIFFNIDKLNSKNDIATNKLYNSLETEDWFNVYWSFLDENKINEYKNKIKNAYGVYYIFIHYYYDKKKCNICPMDITICDIRINNGEVQAKRICTLSSEEYINYIMEESKIIINEDFEKYSDYLKIVNNEEIYNRLDVFATATRKIDETYLNNDNDDSKIFYQDITAISFSKAFRRMQDKAQIFTSSKGDHYRTRLTHTYEVLRISKIITRKINKKLDEIKSEFFINEDEIEAIALGHDIGHTPFGHQGERTLNDIINGKYNIILNGGFDLVKDMGGFKHNVQSVRVLTHLEENSLCYNGLNISNRVLEGILKHSKFSKIDVIRLLGKTIYNNLNIEKSYLDNNENEIEFENCKYNNTYLSGKIVHIADEIAQRGSDIEDAVKSNKIKIDDFLKIFETTKYQNKTKEIIDLLKSRPTVKKYDKNDIFLYLFKDKIINFLIDDIINMENIEGIKKEQDRFNLWFSKSIQRFNEIIEEIIMNKVVMSKEVVEFDSKAEKIIKKIFKTYYNNPRLLNDSTIYRIFIDMIDNPFTYHYAVDFRNMNKEYCNKIISDINCLDKNIYNELKKLTTDDENNIKNMMQYELNEILEKDEEKKSIINLKIRYERQKIIIRNICDYIAGMTDSFAVEEYNKIK